jgi:hypothetical protein
MSATSQRRQTCGVQTLVQNLAVNADAVREQNHNFLVDFASNVDASKSCRSKSSQPIRASVMSGEEFETTITA